MTESAAAIAEPIAIEPLWEAPSADEAGDVLRVNLPQSLADRYGSAELTIRFVPQRPTVIVNFVTTLDGVVSFDPANAKGGGEVSGFFEPDRLVMGLLRAVADIVMIGAGTLRADPGGSWTPAGIHQPSAGDFAALRRALGLAPQPTTVVVTASGDIDLDHRGLNRPDVPVLIVTTPAGAEKLKDRRPDVEVVVAGGDSVPMPTLLAILARRNTRVVLCEGGPRLLGDLLDARLVDELFLTVAPQIAGRDEKEERLSLVEGRAFAVDAAPWGTLTGIRRAGNHMFLRYRMRGKE